MVTKEQIEALKKSKLPELYRVIQESKDSHETVFVLENLGYLPEMFDASVLEPFLKSKNDQVRLLAVKNLGKITNIDWINRLANIAKADEDSMVRREAVSSIGRMRSKQAIPQLIELTSDKDPKIVLQAIRGLLVFKENLKVKNALKSLSEHPNEMIQNVIQREFSNGHRANGNQKKDPHPSFPEYMKDVVVEGDVREVAPCVPDESIHLTFTSPPYYNARDYSIYPSYNTYLDFLTSVFRQVHRMTKEGRFLIVNTSPVIIPRVSRAHASKRYPIPFDLHAQLVTLGWEFIDDIIWMKPESSVKNRNGGFQQHRKPLGYKPNPVTEYLMIYRKATDKLLDWNMQQYEWETIQQSRVKDEFETSNVWRIDPTFDKTHSAVFPIELCNRVISYYSYRGDLVFDPFGGSGTLAKAACQLDRHFFLVEQEKKYVERMKQDLQKRSLLSSRETRFLSLSHFEAFSQKINPT
jgi:DNA modification methylase